MRYREIFGRIRDGFVRIDGEGRIVEWSRPFGDLLGYPDEELSRRSIADLTPERWRDLDESMFLGQVMTRGHSEPYLKELTRADGTAVPVEVVVYRHEAVGESDVEGAWILVREVSERVRMERELAQRLDLEDLIMTISNDFINVPSNKIDAEIDHALLLIGEFSGVDRSYVFQFSADGGTMSNTHEWCAEGIISYIGDLQDIPVDRFPWVVRRMREREVVHCDDVAELPPEAGPEREEFERQGILSIVLVPMSLRGEVIGFVGFDAVRGRQSWSDESIALLRIVGDIFANALDRKRTEEALRMSEEKYRATVETSINSIFMADPDTKSLIEWNSSVKRLLAYDDGELAGMALYDLFDETREETDRWVERLREKGGLDLGERRLRRRDGTLVGVEANAALLPTDGRGEVFVVARDITDRKRAECALRESEEKYRMLVERANDGVVIIKDGVFKFVSAGLTALTGWRMEDLVDRPFADFIHPDDVGELLDRYHRRIAGEKFGPIFEIRARRADGTYIPLELNAGLIEYEGGAADLVVIRDITARREREEELRLAMAKLQEFESIINRSPVHVLMWSTEEGWPLEFVSDNISRLGYSADDLVERGSWRDIVHPDDRETLAREISRLSGGMEELRLEHRVVTATGDVRWVVDRMIGLEDDKGRVTRIQGIVIDITERRKAEDALRESEERFRVMFENAHDLLAVTDEDGRIIWTNPAWQRSLGYVSTVDLDGLELVHPDDRDRLIALFRALRDDPEALTNVVHRTRTAAGNYIHLESTARSVSAGGRKRWFFVSHDITDRMKAERFIRESEERYRTLVETMMDGISLIDLEGRIFFCSHQKARMLGYDSPDDLIGMSLLDLIGPGDRDRARGYIQEILEAGKIGNVRIDLIRRDGTTFPAEISATLIRSESGEPLRLVTVIRDITERLAAERALRESEERFREFFENEPAYCYMVSPEGRIIDVNKAALRTLGYTKKELVGQPVEILYAPECRKRAGHLFEEWHREGSIENEEMAIITREGEVRYVLLSVGAVRDPDGAIIHSISVQRDITERKRAEESIRASLREKEVLLREIHHRVKNNMQVISSMMSLQAGYIEDDTMRQVFRESQQRVRSMALIHDKLYQSEDLGRIDFTEYVQSLGIHLLHTYGVEPDRIRFIVRGSEVYLDVEKGVPCGLIINELISNCLKHAFPDGRSGTIEVSIEERDGRVRIVVGDDGVGLPPDLDFRETDTLGLEIVTTLTAQIEGTIDIDRSGGTAFIIEFEAKGGGPDDA